MTADLGTVQYQTYIISDFSPAERHRHARGEDRIRNVWPARAGWAQRTSYGGAGLTLSLPASAIPGSPPGLPSLDIHQRSPVAGRGGTGRGLHLQTMAHACAVLYREGENPLLITDPWLLGSVYWRSWWLQHHPNAEEIDWLAKSAFVYITHEHPDHFHMPSIRRLGRGPTYLFPALSECGYLDYMRQQGFRADVVSPARWLPVGEGVSMLSIPLWNDDSLLLIDTPNALILNMNDAKPLPPVLRAINHLANQIDKPSVLLCSYSPASVVNSFLNENGVLSLRPTRHYVDYACRLCDQLRVDYYFPFASQAVFCRADSIWANEYRTSCDDLRRYWQSRAQLLPPYTTLNLTDFTYTAVPPEQYRAMDPSTVARRTSARAAEEAEAEISAEEIAQLKRKLNAFRWVLRLLFPRGFAFRLGDKRLVYNPRRGELENVAATGGAEGDFVIDVPTATMKEALRNDHLTDLGITMFVRIQLLRPIDLRKAYALFVLFQFDDYGHLRSVRSFVRWVRRGLRYTFALRLPEPRSSHLG
ncbi:MAG: MBL fold metallo-hydrolase [Alphaproteobacteria bacterium]|nr:MBL fold metallo-hydrolase [Alphaproteobacteria bacterium]